jgi:hypothetical protein
MGQALSPRQPAPKLRSTVREQYGTPRKTQSIFQSVSLNRGFSVKAGKIRRDRLQTKKGVVIDHREESQSQAS